MGALESSTCFSSDINLIISPRKAFLSHIPSCFDFYWNLLLDLKWLSRLNSHQNFRGHTCPFCSKIWAVSFRGNSAMGSPLWPVHTQNWLCIHGFAYPSCSITLSRIWVVAHFQETCFEPGIRYPGSEQRIQVAHSDSKSTNIPLSPPPNYQAFIYMGVNFLSFHICKLGRIIMTDRKWSLSHA